MANPLNAIEIHKRAKLIKQIKADYEERKRYETLVGVALSMGSVALGLLISLALI